MHSVTKTSPRLNQINRCFSSFATSNTQPFTPQSDYRELCPESSELPLNRDANRNMSASIDDKQTDGSFPRSKSAGKAKRKKKTYSNRSKQKLAKKAKKTRPKSTGDKRSNLSVKSNREPTRASTGRKRSTNHSKIDAVENTKACNSSTESTRKQLQRSNPLTESSITSQSITSSTPEPEAIQHYFEKRDRTISLMALQALAGKIATYREKYGDIETRHSSIITPPKARRKRQQRIK